MLKLLSSFLPKETKSYIKLVGSLLAHLDTAEERERVLNFAATAINRGSGKMTTAQWTQFGGKGYLGIIGGNSRKHKKTGPHSDQK